MLASTYRSIIDSRLLRMRRLAVRSSRRWPSVSSEMGYIALGSLLDSTPVLNHHRTESLTQVIGCGWTYGRPSMTSVVLKSTLIDDRGYDRIDPSSSIRSSTLTAPLAQILWLTD